MERTIRDCNVAVIGGAGFLGSHLVEHLIQDRGCKVTVIDNLCAGYTGFVHKDADFVHHDITGSEEFLRKLFAGLDIKFVLNYAAWPYIPDSFARPMQVSDVNFMGAVKVINAAQEAKCEGVLQISSAEIYGDGHGRDSFDPEYQDKIDENAPVRPHSTYGAAKAAVDYYCQCAWKERKTPVIALRQFNCVGERETHPYVVPEIISQLARWKQHNGRCPASAELREFSTPVVKLGNNSFRDFLYAGDQARMATELLEKGQAGEVYNLGSETGVKIYDLAKVIGKVMGFEDVKVEPDPARVRPWEIWHLQSDNNKIYSVIEPRPQVGLEESLARTVKWFTQNEQRWPWERK